MSLPEASLQFAAETFVLHGEGALYWPAQRTLMVADLHFEKASFLAAHGSLVPPYDTLDTIARLQRLIAHYQPHRLLLLGDSFHDALAWQRMDDPVRAMLLALQASVPEVIWLEGNHDRSLTAHPLGWFTKQLELGPILFSHDPVETEKPLVIGHYHPKVQVRLARQKIRGRCLIHSPRLMIMPAFGSFTGGLDISDPAITSLFGDDLRQVHLLFRNCVFPISI